MKTKLSFLSICFIFGCCLSYSQPKKIKKLVTKENKISKILGKPMTQKDYNKWRKTFIIPKSTIITLSSQAILANTQPK